MTPDTDRKPIAERVLDLRLSDGSTRRIRVAVFEPEVEQNPGESPAVFYSRVEMEGFRRDTKVATAPGVDSLQSLTFAISLANHYLELAARDGKLLWPDGEAFESDIGVLSEGVDAASRKFAAMSESMAPPPDYEATLQESRVTGGQNALAALDASDESERFSMLAPAALGCVALSDLDKAEALANEVLLGLQSYEESWDYGNALHKAHTALGLVALQRGNVDLAEHHLREAGKTPGSPQLNSFGPSMRLAKALLEAGRTDIVLAYFDQCRKFWSHGEDYLEIWTRKVRAGETPNFLMNLF